MTREEQVRQHGAISDEMVAQWRKVLQDPTVDRKWKEATYKVASEALGMLGQLDRLGVAPPPSTIDPWKE